MFEQTPPRKGDKVRVTYEGKYEPTPHGPLLVSEGSPKRSIFDDATVEVLERADDPEIGLVREVAPTFDGKKKTAVKISAQFSAFPAERAVWVVVETGEVVKDGDVSGLGAVIAALPGTPAAEAEKPSGHCASCECLHDDCGYVIGSAACGESHAVPEVNHRQVEDVPLPPLHVDNEAIVTGRYPEQRERRVFRSDGPEPPDDVKVLEWLQFDPENNRTPYLKRTYNPQLWLWVDNPTDDVGRGMGGVLWPPAPDDFPGEFREVV